MFQVTNSGYASDLTVGEEGCLERPREKKEEFEDERELPPRAVFDELVDADEEEEPETGDSP